MPKIEVKGPIVANDTAWLYHYFGWDATSPNTIKDGLKNAAGEDVVIEINSPGGVCVYGYEMYTAIKEYEGKVTAHVISAMSAATLLVCAADEALISDTGIFMIHNARASADGDYRDMQMEADALREFNAGIINAYVKKTGKSREEIQTLMDKNSYMSPQTAIELGFIDGYMFGEPIQAVDSDLQIIPEEKVHNLIRMIMGESKDEELDNLIGRNHEENGMVAPVQHSILNNITMEGERNMTFKELLAQNPEAMEEVRQMEEEARIKGVMEERKRMKSLDAIASTVSKESLHDAKYGEKPLDGPELAYQAMVKGEKLAASYMKNVEDDLKKSCVADVGVGAAEKPNESDLLASHVNSMKGGK